MGKHPTTLLDIANALGTSIGTVHRALHDNPDVSPMTKARVLQMARTLGYRPNLAARYLSSKKSLRILVNTLEGTTSFWDEVRAGIREEAASIPLRMSRSNFALTLTWENGKKKFLKLPFKTKWMGLLPFPPIPKHFGRGYAAHPAPVFQSCA